MYLLSVLIKLLCTREPHVAHITEVLVELLRLRVMALVLESLTRSTLTLALLGLARFFATLLGAFIFNDPHLTGCFVCACFGNICLFYVLPGIHNGSVEVSLI